MSPLQKAATYTGDIYKFENMEALAILMSPRSGDGVRVVTKEGIYVDNGRYFHANLALHIGKKVKVLFAEEDWGKAYVFTLKSEFIAVAKDYECTGYSRQEVAIAIKGKQKELKQATSKAYKELLKDATKQPELIRSMFEAKKTVEDEFMEEFLLDKDKQAKTAETFATVQANLATSNFDYKQENAEKQLEEQKANARFEKALLIEQKLEQGNEVSEKDLRFYENYKETG